jgi:RNA polymerase sigma-70 factor (ECF subfamily)
MPSSMPTDDEPALVARAQAGDHSAFDVLAERHRPRLVGLLHRITQSQELAQDATQDALTRAWLNIGRFEGRAQFSTWLTRIGINQAYDRIGHDPAETLDPDDQVGRPIAGWGDQPDAVFESREFLTAIEQALSRLPLQYRTAIVLRDVEGLSTTEAADTLGIGEPALKSRLHRGRMARRADLDQWFKDGYVV